MRRAANKLNVGCAIIEEPLNTGRGQGPSAANGNDDGNDRFAISGYAKVRLPIFAWSEFGTSKVPLTGNHDGATNDVIGDWREQSGYLHCSKGA